MILALDASTKSTGYSIFSEGKLLKYGCITANSTNLLARIKKMKIEITKIMESKEYSIDTIILEEVRPDLGNTKTYKALTWLQAMIVLLMYENYNLEVTFLYPSEWRKICGILQGRGIKREQLKQEDIKYVTEIFNIQENINDDIADAIGIGYAYLNKNKSKENDNEMIKW